MFFLLLTPLFHYEKFQVHKQEERIIYEHLCTHYPTLSNFNIKNIWLQKYF